MTKTTSYEAFKRDLLTKYPTCQVEGCNRPSEDLHHCVFRRNKRFTEWIDSLDWNFQPTCSICNRHNHKADRVSNRVRWLKRQYGLYPDKIVQDLARAPNKVVLHWWEYAMCVQKIKEWSDGKNKKD